MEQERWKDIIGYEGLYQISNYGRVKSFKGKLKYREKLLKPWLMANGYYIICLCHKKPYKYCLISRLVSLHFIPNPENKAEVNHIDGKPSNNYYKNLEWVTASENHIHSYHILGNEGGTFLKGESIIKPN